MILKAGWVVSALTALKCMRVCENGPSAMKRAVDGRTVSRF